MYNYVLSIVYGNKTFENPILGHGNCHLLYESNQTCKQ